MTFAQNHKKIIATIVLIMVSVFCSFILSYCYFDQITKNMFTRLNQYLFFRVYLGLIIFFIINSAFSIITIKQDVSDRILLILFILIALLLTLKPASPLIPFSEVETGINLDVTNILSDFEQSKFSLALLIGNIGVYIPIGYYSFRVIFREKKALLAVLFFVFYILIVEAIQYFFKLGYFDVNDMLLNTIGFILGLMTVKAVISFKRYRLREK